MKKLFGLLLVFISITCYAQVPALNEIVKTNTLSPSRVGAALEAGEVYTASGTDTYTVSISVTGLYSGSATYAAGDQFTIIFPNANATTTPTLNVNSEGAITIVDNKGDAVAAGDVEGILKLSYDGTNFRIVGGTGSGGGGGGVTSVSGTSNRITSSGGATPAIDIAATYVGQSSITTTGTLTSGGTGTGFTLNFTNSTLTGRIAEANVPLAHLTDVSSTSTAGGTVTLDLNNQNVRGFYGSASFATPKTLALSNTTASGVFIVMLNITNVAAVLTLPVDWKMTDINFDGSTWTPPQTGEYIFGGKLINSVWYVNVAGPYN